MKLREFAKKYDFYYHTVYTAMSFMNSLRRHESDVDYPERTIYESMLAYFKNREEKYLKKANEYTEQINKLMKGKQK